MQQALGVEGAWVSIHRHNHPGGLWVSVGVNRTKTHLFSQRLLCVFCVSGGLLVSGIISWGSAENIWDRWLLELDHELAWRWLCNLTIHRWGWRALGVRRRLRGNNLEQWMHEDIRENKHLPHQHQYSIFWRHQGSLEGVTDEANYCWLSSIRAHHPSLPTSLDGGCH